MIPFVLADALVPIDLPIDRQAKVLQTAPILLVDLVEDVRGFAGWHAVARNSSRKPRFFVGTPLLALSVGWPGLEVPMEALSEETPSTTKKVRSWQVSVVT